MLVLTRRPNESVLLLGLGITVVVLEVRGKSVRLGIEAPPSVRVLRSELIDPACVRPPPAPA